MDKFCVFQRKVTGQSQNTNGLLRMDEFSIKRTKFTLNNDTRTIDTEQFWQILTP
jgi:hypothetical protein